MSSVKKASSDHSPEKKRARHEGRGGGHSVAVRGFETCIHRRFELQARRTPEAVAVTFEGWSLSYRELNARANRLAHHLQRSGVGPESLVAICVERSFDLVVGVL